MAGGGAEPSGAVAVSLRALMAAADAEDLLALVWGPRLDRQQALDLLARAPGLPAGTLASCMAVADRYDALPPDRQHRLRGRLARGLMDNAGMCTPAFLASSRALSPRLAAASPRWPGGA